MEEKIYDVLVIGSGPSALTSAIYTSRGGVSTICLGGENWGGQLMLTTLVENFPGFPDGIQGPDLMQAMRNQAEKFGTVFIQKNVSKLNFKATPFEVEDNSGAVYKAKTIIISTGALTLWLNVPGERDLIGRGVATCAPCDAPFYKDKVVAVVGGGDSAMEESNVLTKYANKVYLIHRRGEFRASKIMQDKILANKKVEILWNTEVKKIKGENKVEALLLMNNLNNKSSELKVDGVFIAIGHKPDSDIFKGIIDMDEKGYIKMTNNGQAKYKTMTNIKGIFVSGDVVDPKYKQAITAAGMGCMAALDALEYLEEEV